MFVVRAIVFFSLLVSCSSCVTLHKDSRPWFYVVGADPQLYRNQKDDSQWRQAVDGLNHLDPDFFIVCGDLIHGANRSDKWLEPEVMAHHNKLADDYHRVAKSLKVPLYNVAGNHDVSLTPTAHTISWYTKRFGPPWYSFEHKNSLFVIIESNLVREPGGAPEIAAEQWSWLVRTIEASAAKGYDHKTLYMHHPVCVKQLAEEADYHNLPLKARADLLRLLHANGFDAVFSGHLHRNSYMKDGDLELITTASCCMGSSKNPAGVRVVKVYKDRLEHIYHAIDALPEAVTFDAP